MFLNFFLIRKAQGLPHPVKRTIFTVMEAGKTSFVTESDDPSLTYDCFPALTFDNAVRVCCRMLLSFIFFVYYVHIVWPFYFLQ